MKRTICLIILLFVGFQPTNSYLARDNLCKLPVQMGSKLKIKQQQGELGITNFVIKGERKIDMLIEAGYQGFVVDNKLWPDHSEQVNFRIKLNFNGECLIIYPSLVEEVIGSSKPLKFYGFTLMNEKYLYPETILHY